MSARGNIFSKGKENVCDYFLRNKNDAASLICKAASANAVRELFFIFTFDDIAKVHVFFFY